MLKRPNPFSTRFIRPDSIDFSSTASACVTDLVSRLSQQDFRSAIIGPHGAGKTCLWSTLLDRLEPDPTLHIVRFCLPRRHRWEDIAKALKVLPEHLPKRPKLLFGVDGFEQLSRRQRASLVRRTRRREVGLVVTSHQEVNAWTFRLSTLVKLEPTIHELHNALNAIKEAWLQDLSHRVSNQAIQSTASIVQASTDFESLCADETLIELGQRYSWDLREVLFTLFDRWEQMANEQGVRETNPVSGQER